MTTLLVGFSKELEAHLQGSPSAFGPCVNIAERFATWRDEVKRARPDLLVINVHALLRQHSFAGEYEGVEVLKHLRLTDGLEPVRTCHVILVSWDSPGEIIKRNPGNAIIFSSGVTFVHTTEIIELLADRVRVQALSQSVATLVDSCFLASVRADYEQPDSAHEISNWWGAWRLIQTIEADDATMPTVVRENMSLLATKQALFLAHASDKPGKVDQKKIKRLQSLVRESAPTICYVDDEADKGWAQAFKTLLYGAKDCSGFRVENPIDVEPTKTPIKDKLPQLAEVILGFAPNLLILDLRLAGKDEASKAPNEATGALLLEEIRKKDKGLPILLMTASNKARTLQDIFKLGADAYWMKEGIGEHAPLDASEKPANELIRLLSALLGMDWQFLLRFQKVHETLRVESERLQCWWSQEKAWKAAFWPGTNPPVRAPLKTTVLTTPDTANPISLLSQVAALYREYLGQDLFAYHGEPRSTESKDLWLRGIAIHAARVIEAVHRFDQIEAYAKTHHLKPMIPRLAEERGDKLGQEIINHRNGAAHYKPGVPFDEYRTRELLGLLSVWLMRDPASYTLQPPPGRAGNRADDRDRLAETLARYENFDQLEVSKLYKLMFTDSPLPDERGCARLLASADLPRIRENEGRRIRPDALLRVVQMESGSRAALALQYLQPFAQLAGIQLALKDRWRGGNTPAPLKCHLIWRIGDYPGLTAAFKTEMRSWIFENFEAWTRSAQEFFCATPENILVAIRKKLDPGGVYPEHKKWIVICCVPISSERDAARQLLSSMLSADKFVEATRAEILERFFPDRAQAAG